jgi:hypothetical protein
MKRFPRVTLLVHFPLRPVTLCHSQSRRGDVVITTRLAVIIIIVDVSAIGCSTCVSSCHRPRRSARGFCIPGSAQPHAASRATRRLCSWAPVPRHSAGTEHGQTSWELSGMTTATVAQSCRHEPQRLRRWCCRDGAHRRRALHIPLPCHCLELPDVSCRVMCKGLTTRLQRALAFLCASRTLPSGSQLVQGKLYTGSRGGSLARLGRHDAVPSPGIMFPVVDQVLS